MTNTFLNKIVEQRGAKMSIIDATLAVASDEERDLTDTELANIKALGSEMEKLDSRIEQLQDLEERRAKVEAITAKIEPAETRTAGGARVTSEEPTYHANSQNSFLQDAMAAEFSRDQDAQDRINRHTRENRLHTRDVGTGAFAGLVVPQYLIDLYAPLARAGRASDRCQRPDVLLLRVVRRGR